MRKFYIVLLLAIAPYFGFAQSTVSGTIVDELGLPIYMASVAIAQTDEITYTDVHGAFVLKSDKGFHWKITITSNGYKSETFFVLDGGKTGPLVLEYNAEMKALLDGNSSLYKSNKDPFKLEIKPSFKRHLAYVYVLKK